MLKGLFSRKAADKFDQVDQMVTRKLPIPDLDGTDKYVQLTAKRDRHGLWTITGKNNMKMITSGMRAIDRAYNAALAKHAADAPKPEKDSPLRMDFDQAYLMLRDMEESLLKYNATPPAEEPPRHYMAAYRLLPQGFREKMDELLRLRTEEAGEILPPRMPKALPAAQKNMRPGNAGPGLN